MLYIFVVGFLRRNAAAEFDVPRSLGAGLRTAFFNFGEKDPLFLKTASCFGRVRFPFCDPLRLVSKSDISETGMDVKRRSPLPRTCYCAYVNGAIGYVPVASAYPEGGYEVTHACQVGPEAAGILTETSLALLHQVA